MRNVKENIGMGDKKSNTKGVSPHLILYFVRTVISYKYQQAERLISAAANPPRSAVRGFVV